MTVGRPLTAPRLARAFAAIVGRRNVLTEAQLAPAREGDVERPLAVVLPESAAEVAAALGCAEENGAQIHVRSASVGPGDLPETDQPAIVLSLSRMNRVLDVDDVDMLATVEPGVSATAFRAANAAKRLFYPPEPAVEAATLGDAIGAGVVGVRALRYGVTRDYVQALEVAIPGGDVIRTGVRVPHFSVGYDLTRLLVGSSGTLGVITRIVVRLLPMPPAMRLMAAYFATADAAAEAATAIVAHRLTPSVMELLDRAAMECALARLGREAPDAAGGMLLIETNGRDEDAARDMMAIEAVCRKGRAVGFEAADGPASSEALWAVRRGVVAGLDAEAARRLDLDVVVPPSRGAELVRRIAAVERDYELRIALYGHVGCGNLHVSLLHPDDAAVALAARRAAAAAARVVVELGGAVSGRGAAAEIVPTTIPPIEREWMGRLKRMFDPRGILNPTWSGFLNAPSPS